MLSYNILQYGSNIIFVKNITKINKTFVSMFYYISLNVTTNHVVVSMQGEHQFKFLVICLVPLIIK